MTEKEDPYHLSGKPLPTTRIAPTNYTETAHDVLGYLLSVERVVPAYSDFESSEKSSASLHLSLENLEEPIP